jgi:hypothetical protein
VAKSSRPFTTPVRKSRWAISGWFVRLQAFGGSPIATATNGTAPNVGLNSYKNVVFFSLRYYPFN